MLWCPNCKKEYQPGFKTCSDCNAELVEEPEKVEASEYDYDKEAFLLSTSNIMEAEIIEALLKSNNIPVLKKTRNADGYLTIYMGATNCEVDLHVPSKLLEEARNIIEADQEMNGDSAVESESDHLDIDESNEKYKKKQRIRTWIILIIFVPGILWVVIGLLLYLFQWLNS